MPRAAVTPGGCRALLFFDPPRSLALELDLDSKLFLCRDPNDNPSYVSKRTIANFILNPTNVTAEFSTLKMRSKDLTDELRPAHIPHMDDCYPLPKTAKFILEFYLRNYFTVPYFLQHLIDPEPVIDLTSPTFQLDFDILFLCMASFSDAIQVVNVPRYPSVVILTVLKAPQSEKRAPHHLAPQSTKRAPYPYVALDPASCPPWVPNVNNVPLNTLILTWNVRGITRESFLRNFSIIYEAMQPSVIILLETRHFLENVTEMIRRLPRHFSFITSPVRAFSGGVAVLWKPEDIKINQHPTFTGPDVINVVLQGTQPSLKKPNLGISKPSFKCCGKRCN